MAQIFDPRILRIWIEILKYTLIPVEQRIYFCSFLRIWRIKWRSRCILIGKILMNFSLKDDWMVCQRLKTDEYHLYYIDCMKTGLKDCSRFPNWQLSIYKGWDAVSRVVLQKFWLNAPINWYFPQTLTRIKIIHGLFRSGKLTLTLNCSFFEKSNSIVSCSIPKIRRNISQDLAGGETWMDFQTHADFLDLYRPETPIWNKCQISARLESIG